MDIKHVAKLANLPLTSDEEKTYSKQLDSVLDYVNQLQAVDTSEVTDTVTVTEETNRMREDKVEECEPLIKGFIKTKAIFTNNDE